MAMLQPSDIISGAGGTGIADWALMSGAALMVSIVLLAFIYVWGVLFRNAGLTANAKQELYEVLVTAIMVPLILGGVLAMSNLEIGSFVPQSAIPSTIDPITQIETPIDPTTNLYDVSAAYFIRVDTDMTGWLEMNYVLNIYIDQMASITPYARPLGVGLVASPMAGFASPLKQLLYNMTVALSVAFIINYAQYVVYVFSMQAFLHYYLPLGVFLRSFTPTRRIGGTLIGVAITFLFIFPALSILTYVMFYNPDAGPLVSFRSVLGDFMTDPAFQDKFTGFFEGGYTSVGGGMLDLITSGLGGLGTMLGNVVGSGFLVFLIFPASVVGWAFTIGFIMPAINVIVLTQAAKVLSKSFGDEVDISSLTRMI